MVGIKFSVERECYRRGLEMVREVTAGFHRLQPQLIPTGQPSLTCTAHVRHSHLSAPHLLQVQGCASLYASLREFVREQELTGQNRFNTRREDLGRQDARRGARFKQLPPVLQLHLKRFEYDTQSGSMRKLQSEFRFPTALRLHRFMRRGWQGSQPEQRPDYTLYAVLSHVGDIGSGHYVAYVRPLGERYIPLLPSVTMLRPARPTHTPQLPRAHTAPHTAPHTARTPPAHRPLPTPHPRTTCPCPSEQAVVRV